MADKTINQLTEDTSPTSDDYFPSWDAGTAASKKVTLANLQAFLRTNYAFWELLGSTTLGSAADVVNVTSFTSRKILMIIINALATAGTISGLLTFNNDTASNYARRNSDGGGADATSTAQANINCQPGTAQYDRLVVMEVSNIAANEKNVRWTAVGANTAGAANAPVRSEGSGKWANTAAQISRADFTNTGTGDFAIGTQMIILGHD